jgi:hypothetical protein
MRVIEREKEHYEVLEVPYGKVYSWRPERIVFECDCGAMLTWTSPVTECRCGARYTEGFLGENRPEDFRAYHPWLEEYEAWREKEREANVNREYFVFVEADNGE